MKTTHGVSINENHIALKSLKVSRRFQFRLHRKVSEYNRVTFPLRESDLQSTLEDKALRPSGRKLQA